MQGRFVKGCRGCSKKSVEPYENAKNHRLAAYLHQTHHIPQHPHPLHPHTHPQTNANLRHSHMPPSHPQTLARSENAPQPLRIRQCPYPLTQPCLHPHHGQPAHSLQRTQQPRPIPVQPKIFFSDPEGYPREKILEESIDGFGGQCCKRRFWDTLVFHRVKDTQRPRFFEHPPAFLTGTVPMCYNMGHQGLGVRD